MAGRTVAKHTRVYIDGYDLSGAARDIGPLSVSFDEAELTAMSDAVKGYLPNNAMVSAGTLNAIFDTTANSSHDRLQAAGVQRNVIVAIGDRAAPVIGDIAFAGQFNQREYKSDVSAGGVVMSVPLENTIVTATQLLYPQAFGLILNNNVARTGANAGTGVGNPSDGQTLFGGWMAYQITAGNGTATLSVDDSADNSAFSALSGATTGSITMAAGVSGVVALGRTATVRRYLRWQLALGTATSVTFVLAFMRAYHGGQ